MIDFRQLLTASQAGVGVQALRWCLRAASLPYGAVMLVRNLCYDRGLLRMSRATVPVISVGNLSVGGTGKSPLVAWLATELRRRNVRVAVLSRGYGQLDNGQNDEALELELQFPDVPHLQHWDRIASAKLASEELDMEVLVLDDGFQHRRLARDLEIVLLDASESPASRWLLPGGVLREPLSSLARAHVVVLTRAARANPVAYTKLLQQVKRHAPRAVILAANHQPANLWNAAGEVLGLEQLSGQPVLAFCAIGHPNSFFASVEELGARVLDRRTWPDHHPFAAEDIASLVQWTQQYPAATRVICTMKDWVKIQSASIGELPLLALRIELKFSEAHVALEQKLNALLATRNSLMDGAL
ncbi:MAG: tetraacyldisaccharide 4'-kinase [Planctomycetales bacterium]|nr:tetraacyldisaccharide 4'-kinase [Planctomycetales bacterium]